MNLLVIITITTGLLFLKGQIGPLYKNWKIDVIEMVCYSNIILFSTAELFALERGNGHVVAPVFASGSITLLLFLYVLAYHVFSEFCLKHWKKLFKQPSQNVDTYIEYPPKDLQDPPKPTFSVIGRPSHNTRPLLATCDYEVDANNDGSRTKIEAHDDDNASTASVDSLSPLLEED